MLVTAKLFPLVREVLNTRRGRYAVDTETTGLRVWLDHRMFSLIIATELESYYFNFNMRDEPELRLDPKCLKELEPFFHAPENTLCLHNAKFDLAALRREGITVKARVHCTEALGRVAKNNLFNYQLAALVKPLDLSKSDAVDSYIEQHRLYSHELNSKGKKVKVPHFDRVPLSIIQPYGETDATITLALAKHQDEEIEKLGWGAPSGRKLPRDVADNEMELTKVFFEMEATGVKIDRAFCARALAHEERLTNQAVQEFKRLTNREFVDSAKELAPAFTALGEAYPTTEKGNPSFTDEVLEGFKTPVAQLVRDYRTHSKNANTYYRNFLKFADSQSIVHASARQGGTETGRVSYADPNLQNLPKTGKLAEEFTVRRAFVPRSGYCFTMIDCDQMEYRMMLDYAGQMDVIDEILHNGLDVHEATALMMGVERDSAKTLNFMLLYGGGVAKLCLAIFNPTLSEALLKLLVNRYLWKKKITDAEQKLLSELPPGIVQANLVELKKAYELQELYFEKLPQVKNFTRGVVDVAKHRGMVRNWAGRVCHIASPQFAYIAPNHLIQGGCADVIKIAMVRLAKFLEGRKSRMLIQIHDEILFEIHESELEIVPELRAIIEGVYTYKYLPLTCSVSHSWKSWADKEKGAPIGQEKRDAV
mgnify:CR=1 FL=1